MFVERWVDRSALLQHFEVAESRAFARALAALAAEPPGIEVFECSELEPST